MSAVLANAGKRHAKSGRQVDRYRRTLGLVFLGDHDVGERLITTVHARRWKGERRPWC